MGDLADDALRLFVALRDFLDSSPNFFAIKKIAVNATPAWSVTNFMVFHINLGLNRAATASMNAAQLHYNYFMKTAILPSVRVEPALRASVESLLEAGETLSGFVENAVRQTVTRRQNQAEFVARGLMSLENAKRTGEYVDAGDVVEKLAQKIAAAKAKLKAPK